MVATSIQIAYIIALLDPFHRSEYLKNCIFLPKLNNCSYDNGKQLICSHHAPTGITDCNSSNGFKELKQMVLIGGPDDTVIMPWQSR